MGEAAIASRRGGKGTLPREALARDRPPGCPGRAAQRRQGLWMHISACLLPAGERTERGAPATARRKPFRSSAAAPLQREGREEPRSRAVPERDPNLHGRAQEPAQWTGG